MTSCPFLGGRTFHEQLIGGDDASHLLLITTSIGVVFFGEFAITALNLLASSIGWQAQYGQRLLSFHERSHGIDTTAPQGFRAQSQQIPEQRCNIRRFRWWF
jgi:hypothetical protein